MIKVNPDLKKMIREKVMNFNQLKYFQAVCKYSNMTKAAESLNISQPSISRAIQDLENEIGTNLFHRVNKKIFLTEEGTFFLKRISNILDELEMTEDIMKDFGNKKNIVKVGVPPLLGTILFPMFFLNFRKMHSNIELEFYEGDSLEISQLLNDDTIDLGLIVSENDICDNYKSKVLHSSEIDYCVSINHKHSKLSSIDFNAIANEPLVLVKEGFAHNKIINQVFKQHNISPTIILYTNQLHTIKDFLKRGIASSFLIKEIAQSDPQIVAIPCNNPLKINVLMIVRKDKYLFDAAKKFITYLRTNPIL